MQELIYYSIVFHLTVTREFPVQAFKTGLIVARNNELVKRCEMVWCSTVCLFHDLVVDTIEVTHIIMNDRLHIMVTVIDT